ncbi:hypothetical protein HN415_02250, partial [Candidatus Woesearchaeota archaeon]|nr:hypothetical protein [Candidatus Woesearchaeota archaeon]
FDTKFKKLYNITKELQIDFMDGKFVKNKSVDIKYVPNLKSYNKKYGLKCEAHLMIKNPIKLISKLNQIGFKKILIHFSAFKTEVELINCLNEIKKYKMIPALVINPNIKLNLIEKLIPKFKTIMLMGVYPGAEGQSFVSTNYLKIKKLRQKFPKLNIQIDGGVNLKTIKKIVDSGANILNSGSFISSSDNPKNSLNILKKLANS